MAVDKLVDSTQLDADLTSVANAIRTKGGTSAQLAFPADFVQAIEDIETGGGISLDDLATKAEPAGAITITASSIADYAFSARTGITSVSAANATSIGRGAFQDCANITSVDAKNATLLGSYWISNNKVQTLVFPNINQSGASYQTRFTTQKAQLLSVDLGGIGRSGVGLNIANKDFESASSLTTLILRSSTLVPLLNISAFNGTPFKSGGTGGTIYIPKVLYDELGTGSSLDYKVATNWSTIYGYGTITWAQIEGSIYETQYADGTPIA